MLCELEVNNIGTYVELITRIDAEQQYRMWFRGQSDYSWGLVPSVQRKDGMGEHYEQYITCLLYTSDAADEEDSVDLVGRRIIKKKTKKTDKKRRKTNTKTIS